MRSSRPLPGGITATWAHQSRMPPWTRGIPARSQPATRIRRASRLSKPSRARSHPASRASRLRAVSGADTTVTRTPGLTAAARSAAAWAFGRPMASSVANSCRFRLEGVKRSPSAATMAPTPSRSMCSSRWPPRPPKPARKTVLDASSACSASVSGPRLRR